MSDAPAHLPPSHQQAWQELADRWPKSKPMPSGAEFEAWLGQVVILRDAQARIDQDGMIIADAKGNPMQHPAIAIATKAQAELRTWGKRFDPNR